MLPRWLRTWMYHTHLLKDDTATQLRYLAPLSLQVWLPVVSSCLFQSRLLFTSIDYYGIEQALCHTSSRCVTPCQSLLLWWAVDVVFLAARLLLRHYGSSFRNQGMCLKTYQMIDSSCEGTITQRVPTTAQPTCSARISWRGTHACSTRHSSISAQMKRNQLTPNSDC